MPTSWVKFADLVVSVVGGGPAGYTYKRVTYFHVNLRQNGRLWLREFNKKFYFMLDGKIMHSAIVVGFKKDDNVIFSYKLIA